MVLKVNVSLLVLILAIVELEVERLVILEWIFVPPRLVLAIPSSWHLHGIWLVIALGIVAAP